MYFSEYMVLCILNENLDFENNYRKHDELMFCKTS